MTIETMINMKEKLVIILPQRKCLSFSHVQLFSTQWTVACQGS